MIGFSPVIDLHAQSKQWIISDARGFDIDVVDVSGIAKVGRGAAASGAGG